jgi:pyrophosphate--fructose-6-phosphate 1-phosphotransferase
MAHPEGSPVKTVALMTTGRIAPCLGPCIAYFVKRYSELAPDVRIVAYRFGYRGLLRGDYFEVGAQEVKDAELLVTKGGAPIGGSRVRLTNRQHLVMRGLVTEGEDPFEKCAAQLFHDKVDIVHVIGSSSAHSTVEKLVKLCFANFGHKMLAVGLPKTIENDIFPIVYSLGALSAADHGAAYFQNIVPELNANPRMLIIHEIKGRSAGWLTAATARAYRRDLDSQTFASAAMGLARDSFEIHAVYLPETEIDFDSEMERLRRCMDRIGNVNIFVAQGTQNAEIAAEMATQGKALPQHAVLKYTLTETGTWFANKFGPGLKAEKVLVQKSGIYVRAAPCVERDKMLIQGMVDAAVGAALRADAILASAAAANGGHGCSASFVVGHDVEKRGQLSLIETRRVRGNKQFDINTPWFVAMLAAIGQPQPVLNVKTIGTAKI